MRARMVPVSLAALVGLMALFSVHAYTAEIEQGAANGIVQGVYVVEAPYTPSAVDDFKDLTGQYPKLLMWYEGWNTDFSVAAMEVAYSRGAAPMVTWEPWLADQSTTLDQIVNGSKDAYIADWAEAAKNYGKRIYLRP